MTAVSIRELSHHTARTLARVKAGETVEITERGRVIGRIVPAGTVRDRLVAQGRIRPARGNRATLHARLKHRLATELIDQTCEVTSLSVQAPGMEI